MTRVCAAWALRPRACGCWVTPIRPCERSRESLALARELSHPFSLAHAQFQVGIFHQFRRDVSETQEQAEALQRLAAEQGLPIYLAAGSVLRGWALAERGHGEEGLAQIHQGLAAPAATAFCRVYFLALLAEACGQAGQVEEGLAALAEALRAVDDKGIGFYEPELHRLKGELLLARARRIRRTPKPVSVRPSRSPAVRGRNPWSCGP